MESLEEKQAGLTRSELVRTGRIRTATTFENKNNQLGDRVFVA